MTQCSPCVVTSLTLRLALSLLSACANSLLKSGMPLSESEVPVQHESAPWLSCEIRMTKVI